ncbi:MAG TPA: GAP family protein [Phototrophicaceae bacterium]|nr:GAP family protein [Phototrophicaceae bacterium]
MTAALFVSLIGIALLDSLNPSLFIAQFFLLTTPRPVPRLLSYIAGVLVVNFTGGVLILSGARTLVTDFFNGLSLEILFGLELTLGLAVLVFGLWYRAQADTAEAKKPRSLRPLHTFFLGMVVMVNELTTALPYFVAIERIAQAELNSGWSFAALALYNLIFSLPLVGFVLLFVVYGQQFSKHLDRIGQVVRSWTPRLIKYLSIGLGGALALDAASYFLIGLPLFTG